MYRLHCFAQSGNSFKVAFLLRALGQPFEMVPVDFFNGQTRDPQWREAHNEMGEAPVLEDGDLTLTQTGVMLQYLADKHGQYGAQSEAEQREILRWMLFDNHKFTAYFAVHRFLRALAPTAPDPAVLAFLRGRVDGAYAVVNKHLSTQPFMLGDRPTIADFSLCGYLYYPEEESGYPVAPRFPHVAAWAQRMKELPGWVSPYELMPGERFAPKWVG